MRKFGKSCSSFATKPPCRCGDRTFATDGGMLLAVRDGRDLPACEARYCETLGEADRAVATGDRVRLSKLAKAAKHTDEAFQAQIDELIRQGAAKESEQGQKGPDVYRKWFRAMKERMDTPRLPALLIGRFPYQTRLLLNTIRCVGRGPARLSFVPRETMRKPVDMLALGDPGGSWTAAVMPMMPDQPHQHAVGVPDLAGRRK